MNINWKIKTFEELTNRELYDILHLRMEVFVVEQNAAYQDADEKDIKSLHLMGTTFSPALHDANKKEEFLVAYCRILPAGLAFDEVSIGRVVSSPKARRTGAGRVLLKKALEVINQKYGNIPVRIGAQLYLKKFYESFGFAQASELYIEDTISHIEMIR